MTNLNGSLITMVPVILKAMPTIVNYLICMHINRNSINTPDAQVSQLMEGIFLFLWCDFF